MTTRDFERRVHGIIRMVAASSTSDSVWASNVVLGDGETVHIRPIRPGDAPALAEFHRRQSSDSIYRRYFTPKPELTPAELERFTTVDLIGRAALVVERYDELIAWASYERWSGRDDAEAAFMVDDHHQGKGIATLLLEHLAAIARSNGIERFTAEVLADNRPMLAVFSRAGWPVERHFESGVIDLDFPLDQTEEFLDSMDRREQRADSRAMARLLLPRSIAVVGATDRPDSVGEALWRHATTSATGPIYAVNPNHSRIGEQRSWPSVRSIPADVSLAVIAVPAAALESVIDDCIESRVRGAIVITAIDGTEVDLPALIDRSRRYGMRIIGPGSMGVAASRPSIGLQGSLVPTVLPPGPVAISMQSGSLGASLLRLAEELGIGMSWFVSLGDRGDVSGNDLLQFWEDDETTRVIAMYTETFGNPRKFARIARRVSRKRPIVAVRTGAAAVGPTGGALYQQAGLIEVPTVAALLDTARILATQPVLYGPRVAVLSNSRSPERLTRAALTTAGLEPVDPPLALDWRASSADFESTVRAAIDAPDVDGIIVVHAPPLAEVFDPPLDEIETASAGATKPIVAVVMGGRNGPLRPGSAVPAFTFPEPAAAALGRVWAYGRWLQTEAVTPPFDIADIDRPRAADVIAAALTNCDDSDDDRRLATLGIAEAAEVLGAYGIAVPPSRRAPVAAAVEAADDVGYPVAVKAARRHLGRSVLAGVALDLADGDGVFDSVAMMHAALGADADEVVVQAMIPPGLDLRIRSTVDERVGPLVAIGLGGATADLLVDESSRLAPLSPAGATALVGGSRAGPALDAAGLPSDAVVDTVLRLAQLVSDHPEVVFADLNPIVVSADRAWVTDATIAVAPARVDPGQLRRLE